MEDGWMECGGQSASSCQQRHPTDFPKGKLHGLGPQFMPLQMIMRSFATASSKKVVEKASGPTKQVFNKKLKNIKASKNDGHQIGVNRTAPLTRALFAVDPEYVSAAEASRSNPSEVQKREIIEAAWSRHEKARKVEQAVCENAFLSSKLNALKELKKVSERLFSEAVKVDYSLPPTHRRIATLSPPSLAGFPIKQDGLSDPM